MANNRKRRTFTAEQKLANVKRHLLDGVLVSDICDELNIRPSVFYGWQQQLFSNGVLAFEVPMGRKPISRERKLQAKVEALEAKLTTKNAVIAEISEEYVALKKESGEP